MKPPADALDSGDTVQPPVAHGVERASAPAVLGGSRLGPIRATRDELDPGAMSAAAIDIGAPAGREASGELWPGRVRATWDDTAAAAAALDDRFAASGTWPSDRPAGSGLHSGFEGGRSTDDEGATAGPAPAVTAAGGTGSDSFSCGVEWARDGGAPASSRFIEEAPGSGDRRLDGIPKFGIAAVTSGGGDDAEDADERPGRRPDPDRIDAGEPRSPAHRTFDPRTLPPRPGAGRIIATILSLLVVAGAVAGGGHFVWKTELVRPALVRRLPPVPVPDMDLTPVHAANAAMSAVVDETAGAALRTDKSSGLSTPGARLTSPGTGSRLAREAPEESRWNAAAEVPDSEDPVPTRAMPNAGTSSSDRSADSRTIPVIESMESARIQPRPAPARNNRSTGPATRVSSPGLPDGAGPREHDDLQGVGVSAAAEPPARRAEVASPDANGSSESGPVYAGAGPLSDSGPRITIRKRVRGDHVAASLERAYSALLAGDGESAAEAYRAVLGHEPGNRDARLGLAAAAARAGRWDEAARHYTRILATHPGDTVARAALIAIHEEDPVRGESRLKALLRSEPEGAHLHFDLGNVYAAQSRWPEAQQSYFTAYRLDRGNADYAYNLAVSLDHLAQPASALGLYREAVDLSRSRPGGFETAAAQQRIADLESLAGAGSESVRSTGEAAAAAPVR
ncbi:MAG: tetratricopeptide repeat protein [Thiotrichales bacterium]|nr:tetratricopeptide repeat protein [Thiotrichales bacterium]